jgi:hypothetical protein
MSSEAIREAKKYIKRSLASQRRLGYSGRVESDVYESAVSETARAVDRLLKAQRRRARAAA